MRTTVTLDDNLLETAKAMSGIEETPAVIRAALKLMIEWEASRRLARMGGSDPDCEAPPRRRQEPDPE